MTRDDSIRLERIRTLNSSQTYHSNPDNEHSKPLPYVPVTSADVEWLLALIDRLANEKTHHDRG